MALSQERGGGFNKATQKKSTERLVNVEGVSGESIKAKSGEEYYVIEPGDTLSMISLRFHTDIMTLCIWNGIMDPDLIYAGDKIRVK